MPRTPDAPRRLPSKRYTIGICGSYGGMNLGDEAILECIVRELRRRLPVTITVLSRNAEDTLTRHSVERAVSVRQLTRFELREEVKQLDLLIVGGGGILFDGEASAFLRPAVLAAEVGVPLMTWSVGVGPLCHRSERQRVRTALHHADLITVRDSRSKLILEELGIHGDIEVTADPAHLLEPEPFTQEMLTHEGVAPGARLVGMSIRGPGPAAPELDQRCHELMANAVDYLIERMQATVLFVPMEDHDLQESHAVAARVANVRHVHFLKGNYAARQIRGLMDHLSFAIGMRLHFLTFAAGANVPLVMLPYGTKTTALADELGLRVAPIASTTDGQFLAAIDRAWDQRAQIRAQIQERMVGLRSRALRTAELAVALLEQTQKARPPQGYLAREINA